MRRNVWLALVALAAGCGQNIGAPNVWVDVGAIEGLLKPEEVDAPVPLVRDVAPDRLRIVTWNVEFGARVEEMAAVLNKEPLASAGIVLLQEEESHPLEHGSRTARLAAEIGMGYVYAPERKQGDGTHGCSILSAYPLENVKIMQLPFVKLPFSGQQRIAIAADVEMAGGVVRVMTTHLDTRLNIADRILQIRPAVIDAPERVLIGGDLNTNSFLWAHGEVPLVSVGSVAGADQAPMMDSYMRRLGFDTPTAGLGPTQKAGGVLPLRLDHIYTRGLKATPGAVERDIALSDHWPVWIDIELP